MNEKNYIKNLCEIPLLNRDNNPMCKKIISIAAGYPDVTSEFSTAVYLDAVTAVLVLSGSGTAYINYKAYPAETGTLLLLSSSHLFRFGGCGADFSCRCLFVSKEFMDEMDSTDMIYRRIRYGVRLYSNPVLVLPPAGAALVQERMEAVERRISKTEHFYYKEMILNALFAFYMDVSDIIERNAARHGSANLTRYEQVIHSFIELLAAHYREEHTVDFYAERLHLSAHYLTQLVKQVTGRSVSDFIFDMLYSEARMLLTHSSQSVQQIAAALNFSDQSSFGKFFKRRAGVSPVDFRKQ